MIISKKSDNLFELYKSGFSFGPIWFKGKRVGEIFRDTKGDWRAAVCPLGLSISFQTPEEEKSTFRLGPSSLVSIFNEAEKLIYAKTS